MDNLGSKTTLKSWEVLDFLKRETDFGYLRLVKPCCHELKMGPFSAPIMVPLSAPKEPNQP